MMTPMDRTASLTPRESDSPATPENLEDLFWAAFDLRIDEALFVNNGREVRHINAGSPTTLVARPSFSPSIMDDDIGYNDFSVPTEPLLTPKSLDARFQFPSPRERKSVKKGGALRLKVPSLKPFVSVVASPSIMSPLTAMKSHWHLPTPGPKTPGPRTPGLRMPVTPGLETPMSPGPKVPPTPALERVSNFLHSMVHMSDAMPPTPGPGAVFEKDSDVRIVEQEIMVDDVDDEQMSGQWSPFFESARVRDTKKWYQPKFGYNHSD